MRDVVHTLHDLTSRGVQFQSLIEQLWEGDCLKLLPKMAGNSVDFILTDPPYITRYRSRDGRSVPNEHHDAWLKPSFAEMYRVLKPDSFAVSFYGWPKADRFLTASRAAGFRVVGHLVFPKRYTSKTHVCETGRCLISIPISTARLGSAAMREYFNPSRSCQ